MRVCFFSRLVTLHAKGGMQYDLDIRARWLLDGGHDVEILTTRHATLPPAHRQSGVQYHFLNKTHPMRQDRAWRTESVRAFLELHEARPFDLVICMGGSGWQYARLRARHAEMPPAVLMVQVPTLQMLSYLLRKPTPINLARVLRHTYYLMVWHKPFGRYFEAVVAVSEWARAYALADGSFASERVHVISNGIDMEQFSPGQAPAALLRKLQIKPDDKIALWVGRLMQSKGWMDALRASAEVVTRIPNYRLVVVAGGVERNRAQFWHTVERLRLKPHVWLVEDADRQDLPDYYRLGHCLVAPFHGPEGQPWVLLEGMACGVPIVTTDIPELREFVGNQDNGVLVRPNRSRELAQAIEMIVSLGEAEHQAMASAVRKLAVDRFDARRAARETMQLLESVVSRTVVTVQQPRLDPIHRSPL